MPRIARIAPAGHVYHVLTRGNNRQDIFFDDADFLKYLDFLARYKDKYSFFLYHYVLMTNHIHLVLETTDHGSLSQIMKGINLSYAQYFKKKYSHVGHFWQDRYKSILISRDEYLLACGSYVELNPVRAGMVGFPGDYRWSSYACYAYGKNDPLTDMQPAYCDLSKDEKDRRKNYRDFVQGILENQNAMKGQMERRRVFGSDAFASSIAQAYKTDAKIKSKGRPRKTKIAEK
jgi:putative transposase